MGVGLGFLSSCWLSLGVHSQVLEVNFSPEMPSIGSNYMAICFYLMQQESVCCSLSHLRTHWNKFYSLRIICLWIKSNSSDLGPYLHPQYLFYYLCNITMEILSIIIRGHTPTQGEGLYKSGVICGHLRILPTTWEVSPCVWSLSSCFICIQKRGFDKGTLLLFSWILISKYINMFILLRVACTFMILII